MSLILCDVVLPWLRLVKIGFLIDFGLDDVLLPDLLPASRPTDAGPL